MPRKRGWGSGQVYQEPSGRWAFRWREGSRQRYSGGHPTKDIAERALAVVHGQLALERAGLPPDTTSGVRLKDLMPGWLDRREATHAAAKEDRYRWEGHLEPWFGRLRPGEVDLAKLRAFVEAKRRELAPGTVRILVSILSSAYEDFIERRLAASNPCRGLPKSLARLLVPDHDPRTVPFLERLEDVRRVFLRLREPLNVAYAIGAMAGLRTGEVFALRWVHVDLKARRIHVRESVKGPLKDKESRIVPLQDGLAPVLEAWKLKTGGTGRVIPPMRCDGAKVDDKHTPGRHLAAALRELDLARPGFGLPGEKGKRQKLWYWCTRHTFASHWVMQGRSIEKLSKILGHYSVVVTERYAHLRPDLFVDEERSAIPLDLAPGAPENARYLPSAAENTPARRRNH